MLRSPTRSLAAAVLLVACVAAVPGMAGGIHNGPRTNRSIPFSDWLDAQTTTIVAWQARNTPVPDAPLANLGVVDYAGKQAAFRGLSLGFSATGTVKVTKYEDGTGDVLVNVDFSNAVTYANDVNNIRIFGYSAFELSVTGATAALSSGHSKPATPLPMLTTRS